MNANTITEDYVSFNTAKLLAEKGFNVVTEKSYILDNTGLCAVKVGLLVNSRPDEKHEIAAPTLQMARKWLRGLNCIIGIDFDKYESAENEKTVVGFGFTVQRKEHPEEFAYIHNEVYDTNEEAEEAAILYCLNTLIK